MTTPVFPPLQHDPAIAAAGAHYAPAGLYAYSKSLPFIGRVTCNVTEIEAGSWQEIVLDYEVGASGVADGAWIKATFKFYSDWALFQTSDPTGANFISAEYQAGPLLPGQSPASVQSLAVRFDQKGHERPYQKAVIVDVVDGYLNAGDHIIIRLGDRRRGGPGTRVQTFVEDAFHVRFYVDPLGTSRFVAVPEDVVIRVSHGPASQLFVNAPRYAQPGQPLPLRISALDRWGNIVRHWALPLVLRVLKEGAVVQELPLAFDADRWASTGLAGDQALRLPEGRYELQAHLPGAPQVPVVQFTVDVSAVFPTARP